ncbi:MAG: 1-phosphofructokinase family hexose kinase [Roseicyclus sp.]
MAILTVTLNPALDLETHVDRLIPGQKLRCTPPRRDPGGGGINVARAVVTLGGAATAAVASGGPGGAGLLQRLAEAGVGVAALPAPGDTRQNLSVIEDATGAQFRFIFPGPGWASGDFEAVRTALLPLVAPGDLVVLSGSLPPGLSTADFLALARALTEAGGQVVADTSGAPLTALAEAALGLKILRMDDAEAQEMTGRPLTEAADSADVARDLVARGAAEIAILARGAEGSILASADGAWFAPAAEVPVVSLTGAGDSFVAGATLALSRGMALPDVLVWGVSAASAAVTTEATELCDPEVFARLVATCAARAI